MGLLIKPIFKMVMRSTSGCLKQAAPNGIYCYGKRKFYDTCATVGCVRQASVKSKYCKSFMCKNYRCEDIKAPPDACRPGNSPYDSPKPAVASPILRVATPFSAF